MNNLIVRMGSSIVGLVAALLIFVPNSRAQYTNGIYAEFNTSMGSFTCRLEYVLAPKACANFIGLATGQRSWLDLPSGVVKTNPFYNGTTFHRVIAGFMNQGGSPNGQGTDGPGYAFIDEFSPTLRHDSFGTLSSANSGPDSNGAQYFVTAGPTPWLNDVHTIFGKLYGGSNVVYAINHVVTGANDKPLTNVTVNSIAIQRIGAAAIGFDVNAHALPLVTNLNLRLAQSGTNVSLTFSNRLNADTRLYSSTNLNQWTAQPLGIEVSGPSPGAVVKSANLARSFFRAAQVQYASPTFAPRQVSGRTLTLNFSGGPGTIVHTFTTTNTGTYTWTGGGPGTITDYTWIQEAFNGKLWPIYHSGIVPMTLSLNFDSATNGTFKGTAYTTPPTAVQGTFLLP